MYLYIFYPKGLDKTEGPVTMISDVARGSVLDVKTPLGFKGQNYNIYCIQINLFRLIKYKENSYAYFKALLKTYAVDFEADDYSTLGKFALWKEQIKTKSIKTL